MEQPIYNPPNPYVGTLRIFPGTMVKIQGRPRPNATRFAINLQTGPSLNPRDDLALHLSPCFTPPRVVRNSLQNGNWGMEEAWGNGMVINPHSPFEIIILAEPEDFKIAINGGHFCEFRHRIPYPEISHLTIDGDVDIDRITISSSAYAPTAQPSVPSSAPAPQPHSYNPNPPYPTGPNAMPMPPAYPVLPTGPEPTGASVQPGPTPTSTVYPHAPVPAYQPPIGPMPTGASYTGGFPGQQGPYPTPNSYPSGPYPTGEPGPYPTGQSGPYPSGQAAGPFPQGSQYGGGGPTPTGSGYHSGNQQPGNSSNPFGNLPINGKALGAVTGIIKQGIYKKFPLAKHFL